MGRKIIGRKHRGIRDPEKQQAIINASLAQKINCPPKDPNEQAIPKSILHIQELQKLMLKSSNATKKKIIYKDSRNERQIGVFKRLKGETDTLFLNRVHMQTEDVLKEAKFADKYNVNIVRNKDTGRIESVRKRPKDELEEYLKNVKKDKSKKKKCKSTRKEDETKLTRSQKKRQKLIMKKQSYIENNTNKEWKREQVSFGEVAHAPPSLTLPRLHKVEHSLTPGKRHLLLKSVLNVSVSLPEHGHEKIKGGNVTDPNTNNCRSVDRKKRLKDLPHLIRQQFEFNQKAAIEAYKQLKAHRRI